MDALAKHKTAAILAGLIILFSAALFVFASGPTTGFAVKKTFQAASSGYAPPLYADAQLAWVDVRTFGAKADGRTDDTRAIQAAINHAKGRPVYLPSGTYVVTSSLKYHTGNANVIQPGAKVPGLRMFGDGMGYTFFDNQVANGALIDVNGVLTDYTFQYGMDLRDFSIKTTTKPAASLGIRLKGAWMGTIERIEVKGLTEDAIRIEGSANYATGDPDSSAYLTVRRSYLQDNGGYGINVHSLNNQNIFLTSFTAEENSIVRNAKGGIRYNGINGVIKGNGLAYNFGAGGLLMYHSGGSRTTQVSQNMFEGNLPHEITVESGALLDFHMNAFTIADYGYGKPAETIRLGTKEQYVFDAQFRNNLFRPTLAEQTVFIVGKNAYGTKITDTFWTNDPKTKYDVQNDDTFIQEGRKIVYGKIEPAPTPTATPTVTPNPSG